MGQRNKAESRGSVLLVFILCHKLKLVLAQPQLQGSSKYVLIFFFVLLTTGIFISTHFFARNSSPLPESDYVCVFFPSKFDELLWSNDFSGRWRFFFFLLLYSIFLLFSFHFSCRDSCPCTVPSELVLFFLFFFYLLPSAVDIYPSVVCRACFFFKGCLAAEQGALFLYGFYTFLKFGFVGFVLSLGQNHATPCGFVLALLLSRFSAWELF